MEIINNVTKTLFYKVLPLSIRRYILSVTDIKRNKSKIFQPFFDETKTIYIHIPKAAGSSISSVLYGQDPWHHRISEYKDLNEDKYNSYLKFAFVREPEDRLVSTYRYFKNLYTGNKYFDYSFVGKCSSFDHFIDEVGKRDLINKDYFFYSSTDYLYLPDGQLGVDFVGKFENLNKDFQSLLVLLKKDLKLPKINISDKKHEKTILISNDTRSIIRDLYKEDYKNFY